MAENGDSQPVEMTPTNQDMRNWAISLPANNIEAKNLRVAIQAEDTLYYGETETTFVVYETLFTEDK